MVLRTVRLLGALFYRYGTSVMYVCFNAQDCLQHVKTRCVHGGHCRNHTVLVPILMDVRLSRCLIVCIDGGIGTMCSTFASSVSQAWLAELFELKILPRSLSHESIFVVLSSIKLKLFRFFRSQL